ncbi:NAD-dependent epimerase/dehydratase family protein [Ruminococcus sp. AF13-28]|jgi:UDP-glucuronate decarboxylase|nr:NAD-dependent epimerase/dehydratase family protein [Ruminococcus sp. AF13-37]RGW20818.1 NAD-dependent epimerase/dehydratase family protein [Ruminococcus sp. AF13-28]
MKKIEIEDYEYVNSFEEISWDSLKYKTILVTGATGLIGSTLIKTLIYVSQKKNLEISIMGIYRNEKKLERVYKDIDIKKVIFVKGDVLNFPNIKEEVDYVVHAANPTSSKFFISYPVETIDTAVNGTYNALEFAKRKNVSSFVYLSSMEVYGIPSRGTKINENNAGQFDTQKIRNCYPLSKQLCENLCSSFAMEYDLNVKNVRLTQTFGPGVEVDDGRVFAEFARCALRKKDIVLKTKGKTERSYLYTIDAVVGILLVMLKGEKGQSYNIANEKSYCSIYDMARMIGDNYGIKVKIDEQDISQMGYADILYMNLDTSKIKQLGWKAKYELSDMFRRMIQVMKVDEAENG